MKISGFLSKSEEWVRSNLSENDLYRYQAYFTIDQEHELKKLEVAHLNAMIELEKMKAKAGA